MATWSGTCCAALTGALNLPGTLSQLNSNVSQLTATLTSLTALLGAL
jgi:hypothetical protein